MRSFVLLQLSDLHFGPNSRFAGEDMSELARRCAGAIRDAREALGWKEGVGLALVTGDVAEAARPKEYDSALEFLGVLAEVLTLRRSAVVFVPGNHDVSWTQCEIVEGQLRDELFDEKELRARLDAVKLARFDDMVARFYDPSLPPHDAAGRGPARPAAAGRVTPLARGAYVHDFEELAVSVAALDSCEVESHRAADHRGLISAEQAQAVLSHWRRDAPADRMRILAVHHNPVPTVPAAVSEWRDWLRSRGDGEKLDARLVEQFAADAVGFEGRELLQALAADAQVSLLFHGHHHASDAIHAWAWIGQGASGDLRVISAGSWSLVDGKLPAEQPVVMQLVRIDPSAKTVHPVLLRYEPRARTHGTVQPGAFILDDVTRGQAPLQLSLPVLPGRREVPRTDRGPLARRGDRASREAVGGRAETMSHAVPVASVALIHRGKVLLLRRAPGVSIGAGLWQLPGGKLEAGEAPLQGAIREAREEIGALIDVQSLRHITDLAVPWLPASSGRTMRMSVYLAEVPAAATEPAVTLSAEHDAHRWVELQPELSQSFRLFGATGRVLRILRRYYALHLPLMSIAEALEQGVPLHDAADERGHAPILAMLGLLGFLDDRAQFSVSSQLSISLVRTLAAWALTEGTLFGDDGHADRLSWPNARPERDEELAFEQHESLLRVFSRRLAKAVSNRAVADIVVTARDEETRRLHLLLRWDFLANKFQIPARGLEDFEPGANADRFAPARYVVAERLHASLSASLAYRDLGHFRTSHVGAGSLDDGPLLRNYEVAVFGVEVPTKEHGHLVDLLARSNRRTLELYEQREPLTRQQLRALPFFVWVPLDALDRGDVQRLYPVQGYDEIVEALGVEVFELASEPAIIRAHASRIPVFPFAREGNAEAVELPWRL